MRGRLGIAEGDFVALALRMTALNPPLPPFAKGGMQIAHPTITHRTSPLSNGTIVRLLGN
jgi:hypothetical protein